MALHPHESLSSLGRRAMPMAAACLLACACVLVGACDRIAHRGAITTTAGVADQPVVNATVHAATSTDRLASSTRETKQAAPGDCFVVLDVSARNDDRQPQVFAEGRLVNVSEHRERSFATPVSMLADEFLSLQVLPPGASVRGKIAWEVPADLPGVLYWIPGNGGQRILLHVQAPVTTSANADGAGIDSTQAPRTVSVASTASHQRDAAITALPGRRTLQVLAPQVDRRVATATPVPGLTPARNEPARNLACQALAARNDPGEKARYLDFFSRECAGYAMPSSWLGAGVDADVDTDADTPPVHGAPRWPPRPGPAFDCTQAYTRAEHLVCEDAVLSLMDWELNRAYAQASRVVDDPDGLRRDEDDWRHRVRDACATSGCIESVYDQRTAQLRALADRQR